MDVIVVGMTAVVNDTVHVQVKVIYHDKQGQTGDGEPRSHCRAISGRRWGVWVAALTIFRYNRNALCEDLVDQGPSLRNPSVELRDTHVYGISAI